MCGDHLSVDGGQAQVQVHERRSLDREQTQIDRDELEGSARVFTFAKVSLGCGRCLRGDRPNRG
jgi:hypothetical protein